MFKVMYGNLKVKRKIDIFLILIKVPYIIFTFPFMVLAASLYAKGLGAFKGPTESKEKIGIVKRILLHISAIYFSIVLWAIIINIIKKSL